MDTRIRLRFKFDQRFGPIRMRILLGLVAALVVSAALALSGGLASRAAGQAGQDVARPSTSSAPARRYYMTRAQVSGADTETVCEPGYHFASIWEIIDPSNLRYNPDLGEDQADSGLGPPADYPAWVRTGGSSVASDRAGYGSCLAWTSSDPADRGSVTWLGTIWEDATGDIGNWQAGATMCNELRRVWCVQNRAHTVYLPLVARSV